MLPVFVPYTRPAQSLVNVPMYPSSATPNASLTGLTGPGGWLGVAVP